jgi:dTMP kinase
VTKKHQNGKLIVFEGIDGSGISTQTERLKNYLMQAHGIKAILAKEPSEGPVGVLIRQILSGRLTDISQSSLALLFAADRMDHNQNKITPILKQGDFVICDRYLWSSIAYQGINCDVSWLEEINQQALKPDFTIFIRVRPETSLQRIYSSRFKTEIFEKRETLEKVLANYGQIFKNWRDRGECVAEIDGEREIDKVETEIIKAVDEFLRKNTRIQERDIPFRRAP